MNTHATAIHPTLGKYAAFIGLDWSHGEHACTLFCPATASSEHIRVQSDPASLRAWFAQLKARFNAAPVALCVEHHRGLLMRELARCEWIDVYAINPATAAGYRRVFTPSGDKSDERDATALLDILMTHPQSLRVLAQRPVKARALEGFCRARRKAVDRRTRFIEALVDLLRTHYPLAMEMVGDDLTLPMALAFLRRWKNTRELLKVRPATLRAFFYKHRSRSSARLERRLAALKAAPQDEPQDEPDEVFALRLTELLDAIETANKAVRAYEAAIRKQTREDERAEFFEQLPGAGPAMAPRLLAAFRLVDPDSAGQMQVETGIAPIRLQTGSSLRTYMRRLCSKFLRQTLHEYAGCSIRYSLWAKAFYAYATQVRKMKPQAAKRALAFKWVRVLTACWKSGQAYDEGRYIETLHRKGVAYLNYLQPEQKNA